MELAIQSEDALHKIMRECLIEWRARRDSNSRLFSDRPHRDQVEERDKKRDKNLSAAVHSSPLQSICGGKKAQKLLSFLGTGMEFTAFTRQGSLVQSQSRPPYISSVYATF